MWATSGFKKKKCKNNSGDIWGCKVPYAYAQSIFKEVFFSKFWPKTNFSLELLRPLVSVNNEFLKFLIFEVLKKLLKFFYFLTRMLRRLCVS